MIRSISLVPPTVAAGSKKVAAAPVQVDSVELSEQASRPVGVPRLGLMCALLVSLGACTTLPPGGGPHLQAQATPAQPTCGRLVFLSEPVAGRPLQVSVHGMNGTPENLRALTAEAGSQGFNTAAFAYEDKQCTLVETASDLTRQLRDWRQANPDLTLRVDAHCMGARISVRALADMGHAVGRAQLNLFTPALAGFAMANTANIVPRPLARLFPGTLPGQDMGTRSGFQARLEQTTLPPSVSTSIYYGQRDEIIDYTEPAHGRIERNLDASVSYVLGAGHMEVLDEVPRGNFTTERPEYQPPRTLKSMFSF